MTTSPVFLSKSTPSGGQYCRPTPGGMRYLAQKLSMLARESTHLNEWKYLRKKFLKQKKRRPMRVAEIERENIKKQELTRISVFISFAFKEDLRRNLEEKISKVL